MKRVDNEYHSGKYHNGEIDPWRTRRLSQAAGLRSGCDGGAAVALFAAL
jgi:hypothetical protein